jgi:hypothetical protein
MVPSPKPIIPKALIKRGANNMTDISAWNALGFGKSAPKLEDGIAKLKFNDVDPLELARQLTLIEFQYYLSIKPGEFLNQAWMKADKDIRAPNICTMIRWSNHVTKWVISEIVTVKDSLKSRAAVMERIVMLAMHLEKMNNFNGVKEVLAGLLSSSVHRLKKTRENMGSKYLKILDDLAKLTSNDLNHKNLRARIHSSEPPLIPFPGVYLTDLVFLDTCQKDTLENDLINFSKFQKIASYVFELDSYKRKRYNFEFVAEIGSYIRNFVVLEEAEAYQNSLACEQRQ